MVLITPYSVLVSTVQGQSCLWCARACAGGRSQSADCAHVTAQKNGRSFAYAIRAVNRTRAKADEWDQGKHAWNKDGCPPPPTHPPPPRASPQSPLPRVSPRSNASLRQRARTARSTLHLHVATFDVARYNLHVAWFTLRVVWARAMPSCWYAERQRRHPTSPSSVYSRRRDRRRRRQSRRCRSLRQSQSPL